MQVDHNDKTSLGRVYEYVSNNLTGVLYYFLNVYGSPSDSDVSPGRGWFSAPRASVPVNVFLTVCSPRWQSTIHIGFVKI